MGGVYKYLQALWKQPKKNLGALYSQRILQWRKEPNTVRLEYPTRLDRARALGYKAKQGYFIVRQRVHRGGRMRPKITGGRRSAHSGRKKVVDMNYQLVAEQRCAREHTNAEVLNSYFVGKDKDFYYYEIILVDRAHPAIKKDLPWLEKNTNRVFRGKTSAAQKSRSLR
ncbi:50S ribosomal protein L15e [Candidatus Woesearchaeota archaeon]|nr:50S ribosomal protein L15e [Candidatus Woesearchaeota archaeon]